jgi:2-polyprenyl-6-methoxyphenol hydroxylase-like FAD-dependent oxidoreductase
LLSVAVDRLREWSRTGLLCIGDCAHAMSPIRGVGINLAIQDAVAAANILARPLLKGEVSREELGEFHKRREYPTRMTQSFQVFAHRHVIGPTLGKQKTIRCFPLPFRLLQRFPLLRRIPARAIGLGFQPEHIRTPEAGHVTQSG